jgi:hypothetical protein
MICHPHYKDAYNDVGSDTFLPPPVLMHFTRRPCAVGVVCCNMCSSMLSCRNKDTWSRLNDSQSYALIAIVQGSCSDKGAEMSK